MQLLRDWHDCGLPTATRPVPFSTRFEPIPQAVRASDSPMNQASFPSPRQILAGLLLITIPSLAGAQSPAHDNFKGRWMNYEVGTMGAFAVDPGTGDVYSFNQPGARVFLAPGGVPDLQSQVPVGPGTASIAFRPESHELWVVDRVTSTIAVIQTLTGQVIEVIQVGAEPHMVVFTASGEQAFVTCAAAGQVDVIDTFMYAVKKSIPIPARSPRGLAIVGDSVFVTPLLSGNGSVPRGNPTNGRTDDIVDIDVPGPASGTRKLPDHDLYVIRVRALAEDAHLDADATVSGLGTVLYNVRQRPGTAELWVPHTEALNVPFKGEKSYIDGQVTRNRIAVIDTTQLGASSAITMIDLDALIPVDLRCSTPTDVAFTSDGALAFVSGYGSDTIAVLSPRGGQATWLGSIRLTPAEDYPDGVGPRSLTLSADDSVLMVHNKGTNSMTRIVLDQLPTTPGFAHSTTPASTKPLGWDPAPVDINQGRIHFNRTQNSASNTTSCMTCHVDGDVDGIAWDLSGYIDPEGLAPTTLAFPVDNKGPLVTQSVRRLKEVGPYHWRGEKKKLKQFNGTFIDLMERTEGGALKHLSGAFFYVVQYMEHLALAHNPRQAADRSLTAIQAAGFDLFQNRTVLGNQTCTDCHSLPLGTAGEIVDNRSDGLAPTGVVPSLRGVADKASTELVIGGAYGTRTEAGIGYGHAGAYPSLERFLIEHASAVAPGTVQDLTPDEAHKLSEFLRVFDTGSAPASAWQSIARRANHQSFVAAELAAQEAQAQLGYCDLIYRYGPVDWNGQQIYMSGMFNPQTGRYASAAMGQPSVSSADLMAIAASDQPVVFLGLPPFMGSPVALDRDNDNVYDLDEILYGTDPENNDTDDDGFHDGYELSWQMNPLVPNTSSPDQRSPQLTGPVQVMYTTTNTVKLEFHTDEPVRCLLSFNGGPPVLRAPLKPKQDVDFSLVVGELKSNTVYDFELHLTDLAGNVTLSHVIVPTKAYSLPNPAHVVNLDLSIIQDASGTGPSDFAARVTMELSPGSPAVGYTVQVVAYYSAYDESQQINLGTFVGNTNRAGRHGFRIVVPQSLPSGLGEVYFVVEKVTAPVGMPIYAEGDDIEMFASIPY